MWFSGGKLQLCIMEQTLRVTYGIFENSNLLYSAKHLP